MALQDLWLEGIDVDAALYDIRDDDTQAWEVRALAGATSFGELEKLMAARAMLWVEADDRGLTPAKADNPYWTTMPEGPRASFSERFELGTHWTPFLPSELLPED